MFWLHIPLLPTSASKHNWTGWDESESATIVHSCPSVVCQHVSVFLGSHEIDFLPVGKQYCKGGNHSRSVLCLTGLWGGKNRGACGAGSKAARYGGRVTILTTSTVYMVRVRVIYN